MIAPLVIAEYRAHLAQRLTERGVPEHLHRGLLAYFTERKRPGSFLESALENNLYRTLGSAQETSCDRLMALVLFFVWDVPEGSWGSAEKVQAWLAESGPVPTLFE